MKNKVAILGRGKLGSSLVRVLHEHELYTTRRRDLVFSPKANKKAVQNSELICLLTRPEQVDQLLEEIEDYLDNSKLLINFSTKILESEYPLVNVACSPIVNEKIKALFYKENGKVTEEHLEKFREVFAPVSDFFSECESPLMELATMSRVYSHLLNYYQSLVGEGMGHSHLTAYFELVTDTLADNPDVNGIKEKATTKKGFTEAMFGFYSDDRRFDILVEAEREILEKRLKWIQKE